MTWALAHDVIEYNPCSQIKITDLVGEFLARQRVLSDAELKLVWHGAAALGYPYGPIFQLLMLLGQRKSEIGNVSWSEVDLEKSILRIPGSRMKTGSSHVVPLPPKSMQLLVELPRFSGPYIFSTTDGGAPVTGYSTAKQNLDRAVAKLGCVAQFTTHDLRRTVRTGLSSLRVPTIVSELVIAHAQQGIHRVYDLYAFEKEKRQALASWERHLLRIASG
jgi:integrase